MDRTSGVSPATRSLKVSVGPMLQHILPAGARLKRREGRSFVTVTEARIKRRSWLKRRLKTGHNNRRQSSSVSETNLSPKAKEARRSLPEELWPIFGDLVFDYRVAATQRHGNPWVSYVVLADLVRSGWRRTEDPRG